MALTKVTGSGADGLTLSSTDVTVASGDLLFGTANKGVIVVVKLVVTKDVLLICLSVLVVPLATCTTYLLVPSAVCPRMLSTLNVLIVYPIKRPVKYASLLLR